MSEHKKKKNPAATMMMTSLAYIVLGIVTVVFPQKVLDVLCYALGGAMTVYGLFNIISFFVDREGGMYFELVIGVISTGFGIGMDEDHEFDGTIPTTEQEEGGLSK